MSIRDDIAYIGVITYAKFMSLNSGVMDRTFWLSKVVISRILAASPYNTRMWANAQRDGRPAEYRWRPLFNAAKFG